MGRKFNWVAVCRYPDKELFAFYSQTFVVDHIDDLEKVGTQMVAEAWEKISPHPAPPIVEYIAGTLEYYKDESDDA